MATTSIIPVLCLGFATNGAREPRTNTGWPAGHNGAIQQRIHVIRGKRVMLDADLARFYGVTTFNLNKAVSRNLDRFLDDFSFVLTKEESANLIFQSGISKPGRDGRGYPGYHG